MTSLRLTALAPEIERLNRLSATCWGSNEPIRALHAGNAPHVDPLSQWSTRPTLDAASDTDLQAGNRGLTW